MPVANQITSEMRFRGVLLQISKQLGESDVKQMKFLIGGLPNKPGAGELENVKTGLDIFMFLIQRSCISEEDCWLLGYLLKEIGQLVLVDQLKKFKDISRPNDMSTTSGDHGDTMNMLLKRRAPAEEPIRPLKSPWPSSMDLPKPLRSDEYHDLEIDSSSVTPARPNQGDRLFGMIDDMATPITSATCGDTARAGGNKGHNLQQFSGSSDDAAANGFSLAKEAIQVTRYGNGGILQVFVSINQPRRGADNMNKPNLDSVEPHPGGVRQDNRDGVEVILRMNQE